MLDFYMQHFDTLELNNSFYRLPTVAAFDCWRDATPDNFIFAVKASRFITHNKKLKDPENAVDNLLPRAAHLGHKLGPMLFQLPPKWRVNPSACGTSSDSAARPSLCFRVSRTFLDQLLKWICDSAGV